MHRPAAARHSIVTQGGNSPACGYTILNERRLKQLDELMDRLAHPEGGLAGSGDLNIRVQDGKLRFARPMPYPIALNLPDRANGCKAAAGLKILDEQIAQAIDAMLDYLVRWGNGDLHILIFNGAYQAAIPVPDIAVER